MDDFYKDKERKHNWYLKNKDRLIKKATEYAARNKIKTKIYKSNLYFKNKKHFSLKSKIYYLKNKDYIIFKVKKYYLNNREKRLLEASNYQTLNKDKRNARHKKRYQCDVRYKLNQRIHGAVLQSLKAKGLRKDKANWEKLLGFSKEDLKKYLFVDNKLEEAYLLGKFDIDHKTPISWFSFSSEKDLAFRNAWSLENLQLLPHKENNIKSNCYCADVLLALSLIGRG